jgi:hypothetical protein
MRIGRKPPLRLATTAVVTIKVFVFNQVRLALGMHFRGQDVMKGDGK